MRIHDVFVKALDLIFPPSGDALLVRTLTSRAVPALFRPEFVHDVMVLSNFHEPRVRALIHEAKFHGSKKAFEMLSELLMMHLEKNSSRYNIIAPIPLSRRRERTRGYNQVHEILKACTLKESLMLAPALMRRIRDTKPQTDLSRTDRLVNVRDAFGVTDWSLVTGKHILLVDDVLTTGATLREARKALLLHNPASVTLLALAH